MDVFTLEEGSCPLLSGRVSYHFTVGWHPSQCIHLKSRSDEDRRATSSPKKAAMKSLPSTPRLCIEILISVFHLMVRLTFLFPIMSYIPVTRLLIQDIQALCAAFISESFAQSAVFIRFWWIETLCLSSPHWMKKRPIFNFAQRILSIYPSYLK